MTGGARDGVLLRVAEEATDVSIVVVTWNCRDLAVQCLASIAAQRLDPSPEVIVVDNASADDTVAAVREHFPSARVLANDANLGFSRASNLGIETARGRYVMLLNPDAELLHDDTLARLVRFMDEHEDVGAAGPTLIDAGGYEQVGSAGYRPGPWTLLAHSLLLARLSNNRVKGLCLVPLPEGWSEPITVDWICAACVIVRRSTLEQAGRLDESYFMYGEDIEWTCRMSELGWRLVHLPDLRVRHLLGGTQTEERKSYPAWIDGLARVYMESGTNRSWYFFKLCLAAGFALRAVGYAGGGLLGGNRRWRDRAALTFGWCRHLLRAPKRITRGFLP